MDTSIKNLLDLNKNDYDQAYQRLEDFAVKNGNLLLFGQFGEVKDPSISDLDILVCCKDEKFDESRQKLLEYIQRDTQLSYMCSHNPLIIPVRLLEALPRMHTMYGLNLTFNELDYSLPPVENEYFDLLNLFWTTFLLPIAIKTVLDEKKHDSRFKLLLLKNLHQSVENFDEASNALEKSHSMRNKYKQGLLDESDINREIDHSITKIFELLDTVTIGINKNLSRSSYLFRKDLRIQFSENREPFYHQNKNGIITLLFNKEIFKLFEVLFNRVDNTGNANLNLYMQNAYDTYQVCKELNFSYPFISPFGFSFFRDEISFKVKKAVGKYL